jgi:hypothetical protein
MRRRLRAFALLAGLLVVGVGCGTTQSQKPPVVDPDSDPPGPVTSTPAAIAPAGGAGGPGAGTASGAPEMNSSTMVRPIPTVRGRTYAFPVATLPGFEMLPDGGSRVFVEVTRKVEVEERRAARVLTYVLKGARVVYRNNENALVTVHFNTPVTQARLLPSGRDLIFSVDLRADTAATWKMIGDSDGTAILQVDFPKGSFLPTGDVDDRMTAAALPPPRVAAPPEAPPQMPKRPWRGARAQPPAASGPTPLGPSVGPTGN